MRKTIIFIFLITSLTFSQGMYLEKEQDAFSISGNYSSESKKEYYESDFIGEITYTFAGKIDLLYGWTSNN